MGYTTLVCTTIMVAILMMKTSAFVGVGIPGDLPSKIEVHSIISTYMDFGTVSQSERESIVPILNANNFSTSVCITQINNATYLETRSSYMCFTNYVTQRLYQIFLMGRSIDNRVDRFQYYGKKYAKLPPCLPTTIDNDQQRAEEFAEHKRKLKGGPNNPWSVTLHPDKPVWKEAKFPIYGFAHYVHFLLPCSETPQLCHTGNSTNTIPSC